MQFPCETLAKDIIPAIRAIMVKELKEKYNKPQKEIAKILGITETSVSYYIRGTRGGKAIKIIEESEMYETLIELTDNLANNNSNHEEVIHKICSICSKVRPIYIKEVNSDKS
ncbi:MAG: helix-turn-helix domain-containing protein [Candidatus Helarchaeota archaeon]|nr:helix-turn-helix domain-containing protein [Candidatus Helarchaeota archaeon]